VSKERLQKILAGAGCGSRRECETFVRDGRVTVNGQTVTQLGTQADPVKDVITLDGKPVRHSTLRTIVLYKPRGVISTRRDPHAHRTVVDILPQQFSQLVPVGRLDLRSEGLLLMSNDGDLAYRLTHPSFQVPKTYGATLDGLAPDDVLQAFCDGVELEDGRTSPAHATLTARDKATGRTRVQVTITEGRKRQVRRMFEALGYPVLRLTRLSMGPVELGGLKPGEWRELTEKEARELEEMKHPRQQSARPAKPRAAQARPAPARPARPRIQRRRPKP